MNVLGYFNFLGYKTYTLSIPIESILCDTPCMWFEPFSPSEAHTTSLSISLLKKQCILIVILLGNNFQIIILHMQI